MHFTKKYRMGFSSGGMTAVLLVLLPSVLWSLYPPAHNVLTGNSSSVLFLELGEQIFRVIAMGLLLFVVSKTNRREKKYKNIGFAFLLVYYFLWLLYYLGYRQGVLLLGMALCPCAALVFTSLYLNNKPAVISSTLFLFFHSLITATNFLF